MNFSLSYSAATPKVPQIQCGTCQERLPLRLTEGNEPAAVWLCAQCQVPFVACCVEKALLKQSHLVRLHERSFDVSGTDPISAEERHRAISLVSRPMYSTQLEKRQTDRVAQSMVVPGVKLGAGFTPEGNPFQIMIANLSSDSVGFVHDEFVDSDYMAIELEPASEAPIQVIVRVARQRELSPPYYELDGEFLVRLGSLPIH